MSHTYYDIVIIGAGPAGLALAQCCQNMQKKILIVDKEASIGGCHRVKRTRDGLFTEHGPRMYFGFYVNFFYLLSEMGLYKDDLFVGYVADISKLFEIVSFYELIVILLAYIVYVFNCTYYNDTSLAVFCYDKGFSKKSTDAIDRLCRMIDGATIHQYSVSKFLQSIDNIFYANLQPRKPLDKALFNTWYSYLYHKNVEFALASEVTYIHHNPNSNKIDYVVIDNHITVYCSKLVFAIPPKALVALLQNQDDVDVKNSFGEIHLLDAWSKLTEYIDYVSITYHFRKGFNTGNAKISFDTDWGLVTVKLSDYMSEIEKDYVAVISTAITIVDRKSRVLGKTANECDAKELCNEVYRQLRGIYELPDDYTAVVNPNNYYEHGKWKCKDNAYFHTVATKYLAFNSRTISNIYNLGSHNGHSHVGYTTLESAVSNAMSLACKFYPQLRERYYIRNYLKLRDIVITCIMIFVFMLIVYLVRPR